MNSSKALRWFLVVALLAVVAGVALYWVGKKPTPEPPAPSPEAVAPVTPPVASTPPATSATAAPTPTPPLALPPTPPTPPAPPSPTATAPAVPTPAPDQAATEPPTAPTPLRFVTTSPDNEMLIEGSATGHGWRVKGAILQGVFEVEPAWQTDLTLASVQCLGEGKTPPKCVLAIPVVTLKSQVSVGSGIMDGRMREELKAAQHRSIQYELTEMKLAGAVPPSGSPVTFDTRGRLAIAGQTNTVSFQVVMERPAADRLTFTGSYKTKMTEFGVTPPEFTVLGVGSRTADDITLSWKWTVGLQPLGR